jgi:hypothetical protein
VRRRTAAWAAACLVLTACGVGMPDSGPVHVTTATGSNRDELPGNIDPPRPKKGATAEEIVSGFLDAMTATPPIRTSVAREFLTQEASASWQPTGMIVYAAPQTPRGTNEVDVQLNDADRIDASGAWLGPVPEDDATVTFKMALEDGEWRISEPPPDLLVPQSWFAQRFRQVSLYFYDPSTSVLVPEPVFVPRGRQFASTLVNGLLQGPSHDLAEENYLPSGLHSLVSVPVSSSGVAQVDLTSDAGDAALPSSEQSELLVSQLAWTLRQDPTISRFRVSIDERPVQLAGESEFSVEHGHGYAPYVAGSSTMLFGLKDGLMVGGSPQNLENVTGPFGRAGYSLRTVSPDLHAEEVAAVTTNGAELWLGPVKDTGANPIRLIPDGEDLLRPAWDFNGRLWEVDRRDSGAVVYYLHNGKMHVVDVPGVSTEDVKEFLVSRDGSRLVAVVRSAPETDTIVVSRILSSGDGHVVQALPAHDITEPETLPGQIRAIAWYSPTSLVVLRPVTRALFRVRSASVDGAAPADALSVPIEEDVLGLAGTPDPDEPSYSFAPAGPDDPAAILTDLAGPTGNEIDIDPGVTMLSYVG